MMDSLRPFLIVPLTAVIFAGLSWVLARSKPKALSGQRGTIRPERWSAWITVIFGVLMFGVALMFLFYGNGGWGAAASALFGAAIAGFMAPSVTSAHAVNWNADGIEGPSKTLGPTLGFTRTEITWNEITATGKTITRYWFVESKDGRRVYWSYLYKGYGSLTLALQRNCPSVALPVDLA
jgi:hypothetical protein